MRNVFDQYEQPENRLTHALATVLDRDSSLLVPFLHSLNIPGIPSSNSLRIIEQRVPGQLAEDLLNEDQDGLPDAAVFNEAGWAVLFESKAKKNSVSLNQLARHRKTAECHGFISPWVVAISLEPLTVKLPPRTINSTWRDTYSWFHARASTSQWAKWFSEYLEIWERKMVAREYMTAGTVTKFNGLHFDEDSPYTYLEGKRLVGLLRSELQRRNDLQIEPLLMDGSASGRGRITGSRADGVWDFIPLQIAGGANNFTSYPHLTLAISRHHARAAITVPNGIKGGFKSKLKDMREEGFLKLVTQLEKNIRPVVNRSIESRPMIYITQRHHLTQSSPPVQDARLDADLRTAIPATKSKVRFQPQWAEAIYAVLTNKRSNIQFGAEVQFSYTCPIVRSEKCVDLFAETWKAFAPLIEFAT